MATLLPWPRVKFWNPLTNTPLAGGKVYTYEAGTTIPVTTYTDSSGDPGSANTNPVILDAAGEANIWIEGNIKINVTDANDVQVSGFPIDGITTTYQSAFSATSISGTPNDILVLTTIPGDFRYEFGNTLTIVPVGLSTGPVTIDVNGLGPISVKKRSPGGLAELQPGDFTPGDAFYLFFDGTQFQAVNVIYVPVAQLYSTNIVAGITDFLINHIATTDISITLPNAALFPNYFAFPMLALGGDITLVPDAGDSIQGGPAGDSFVVTEGSSASLSTDGTSWYLNYFAAPYSPPTPPPPPLGHIYGYLPTSISGTSTTATLTVTAGQAADSTGFDYITKASTTAWAVSNGNAINGYQGGTTLPNSSTIYFFACTGTSGTGVFAHNGLSPTLPSGYNTSYRLIFSLRTTSAGALRVGTATEVEGGAYIFEYDDPPLDISTTTLSTTRTLYPLEVPAGYKTMPLYRTNTSGVSRSIIFSSGSGPDLAPVAYADVGFTVSPGMDINYNQGSTNSSWQNRSGVLLTNTSSQIGARASSASTPLYWVTLGYKDFRRT